MFLAALALRPQIVGVGPLIEQIQDDLGASHAVVGLLGTIPVLCMGIFAPVAGYLGALLGTRRAMTIALALIGAFGVLRAVVPSIWLVLLLTFPVGMGMGLGNALAPLDGRSCASPSRSSTTHAIVRTQALTESAISAPRQPPSTAASGTASAAARVEPI